MPYDRTKPFNELPLLPPTDVEDDVEVLKKLVNASRALASTNSSLHRLPNPTMLVNTIALHELVDAKILSDAKDGKEVFYIDDDLIKILKC